MTDKRQERRERLLQANRKLQKALAAGEVERCPECRRFSAYDVETAQRVTSKLCEVREMPDHAGSEWTCWFCGDSHASSRPAIDVGSPTDSYGDQDQHEAYDAILAEGDRLGI